MVQLLDQSADSGMACPESESCLLEWLNLMLFQDAFGDSAAEGNAVFIKVSHMLDPNTGIFIHS